MPRPSRADELDRAIDRLLAQPEASPPDAPDPLAGLLRVAGRLRELPREDFRRRLGAELARRAAEGSTRTTEIREGFHTITPYVTVREAPELLEFVRGAFGAEVLSRTAGSGGGLHAEVRIGDSMVMIGGGGSWRGTPMPTALHFYVPDVDATYAQALRAGATSMMPPTEQEYGERSASVRDLCGNHWYIATHHGPSHAPAGLRDVTPYLHPRGAERLIDFLERALAAQPVERHAAPDGTIVHAKLRIGDSIVELGEAHGEYEPMPTALYVYVPDADAAYARAMAAGATSLWPPAEQPYGERGAGVEDPFGNRWYFATPRARA